MRLSELNPLIQVDANGETGRLVFDCPHCKKETISIPFHKGEGAHSPVVWGWNGEKDEKKITITPSINFEKHWHGYVTDGNIVNA
jgi:hypothetical protein